MVDLPFQPARFAGDAVVFVTSKNSTRNSNYFRRNKKMNFYQISKKMIFDGASTGNFNFVAQKFNIDPQNVKFSVIKGNEQIIDQIDKYPK